jgi:hypothetical protein
LQLCGGSPSSFSAEPGAAPVHRTEYSQRTV